MSVNNNTIQPALLSTSSERERVQREKNSAAATATWTRCMTCWTKTKNTAMLQSRGRRVKHASCLARPTTEAHPYAAFSSVQGVPFKGSSTRINTGQVTNSAQGVSFKGSPQGCQRQAEMEWRLRTILLKRNATAIARPPWAWWDSKSFRMALARWPNDQIYLHVYLHTNKIGINMESQFRLGLYRHRPVLASDKSGHIRLLLTFILLCIQMKANNGKQTIWCSAIKYFSVTTSRCYRFKSF